MASESVMRVELVAADRLVWSGEATMVIARTTEGDVGILPGHAPMLSLMVHGLVDVTTTDDETWIAAVDEGFLSVANDRISILAEHAQMSHEIDLEKARHDLERAHLAMENDDAAAEVAAAAWAEARIRAAERAS
jgi:F-type H+-transporting ATPase subunit epsilon